MGCTTSTPHRSQSPAARLPALQSLSGLPRHDRGQRPITQANPPGEPLGPFPVTARPARPNYPAKAAAADQQQPGKRSERPTATAERPAQQQPGRASPALTGQRIRRKRVGVSLPVRSFHAKNARSAAIRADRDPWERTDKPKTGFPPLASTSRPDLDAIEGRAWPRVRPWGRGEAGNVGHRGAPRPGKVDPDPPPPLACPRVIYLPPPVPKSGTEKGLWRVQRNLYGYKKPCAGVNFGGLSLA